VPRVAPLAVAHTREDAMMKLLSTISAFTLILMVSASAQEGLRRSDRRYMGEQQRRDLYQQQRRRDYMRAERPDEPTLARISHASLS